MNTSPFQSNAANHRDLRRHRRFKVDAGAIQVSWLDPSGKMKMTRTRALNISENGIALQLPEPVLPLLVRFQSERFNVTGLGTVQYCRREGPKYVVGLEFTENLHWCAPAGEVREPIPLCDPGSSGSWQRQ